ncbi:MAG: hypothetical protein K0M45_06660 [Candidatus Paracaedibacteraceae bacterium]|nr:hypothetical protein [Candidatus Paracaedibacteraceae bacterium]
MKCITAISMLSLALLTLSLPSHTMEPESEPIDECSQRTFSWLNKHRKVEVTTSFETETTKVGDFTFISYYVGTITGPYTLRNNPNHHSQALNEIEEDKKRIEGIIQELIEIFKCNLSRPPIIALQEWPRRDYELLRTKLNNVPINGRNLPLGLIEGPIPDTQLSNVLIFMSNQFKEVSNSSAGHLNSLAKLKTESGKSQHNTALTVDFIWQHTPLIKFTVLNVNLRWKSNVDDVFNVWLKPFFEYHESDNVVIMGNLNVDFTGKYDEASSFPVKVKFNHGETIYDTLHARRVQRVKPQTTDAIFYLLSKQSSRGMFKDWVFPLAAPESEALKPADYNYEEVPLEEISQEDFLKYVIDSEASKQYGELLKIISKEDNNTYVIKKHLIEIALLPSDQQRERVFQLLNGGVTDLLHRLSDQSLQEKLMNLWQAKKISISYLLNLLPRVYKNSAKIEEELDALDKKN